MSDIDLMALATAIAGGGIAMIDLTHSLTPNFPTIVMPPEDTRDARDMPDASGTST